LKTGKKQKQLPYTKAERDRCENCRGITLGNTAYKILWNIILGKKKPYIEKIMGDYQNGIKDRKSVNDNIFGLKIINNKLCGCIIFIYFKMAYESIHRYAP